MKSKKKVAKSVTVALAGNPNVGKSTLFNTITGLRRHTGNWTGKTVDCASAACRWDLSLRLIDLPGMYAWHEGEQVLTEESEALRCLRSEHVDAIVVVCDARALSRNLFLVLQLKEQLQLPMAVMVNLCGEAREHGMEVDRQALQEHLGLPVYSVEAYNKKEVRALATDLLNLPNIPCPSVDLPASAEQAAAIAASVTRRLNRQESECSADQRERRLDRWLTGKISGYFTMLVLLSGILWLTMVGANLISDALAAGLGQVENGLRQLCSACRVPTLWQDFLLGGVIRTVFWVIAVMLPPMAIFFPLFSALEDLGYLPRVAFLLDRPFARCRACGKQALTMCMGLGCNSVGVMGCRIIDSPRERKIAMLTNSFVPCNGRLPTLSLLITLFFTFGCLDAAVSALGLLLCLCLSLAVSMGTSYALSRTLLRGEDSSFVLELPPYRRPRWGQLLVRSILDRTLKIMLRAIQISAPAGAIVWGLSHITIGGLSLLDHLSGALQGPGAYLGVDGVILLALLLSFPANELFLPLLLMLYRNGTVIEPLSAYAKLREVLLAAGWDRGIALCAMILVLFHFPCATTLSTIYKESRSLRFTVLSALLPLAIGAALCFVFFRFL